MRTLEELIQTLKLIPQEGGYYVEKHRAELKINCEETHGGERSAYSSIYFLLPGRDFSAWHKIASDETWYFHAGCDLNLYTLDEQTGAVHRNELGLNSAIFQITVKADAWFCAKPCEEASYSLVSCSVGPGFDFKDFILATEIELVEKFPQHADFIKEFIRHKPVVSIESQKAVTQAPFASMYQSDDGAQTREGGAVIVCTR